MVYVLKDGTRWKIEPQVHMTKKHLTVDLDKVVRFECILTKEANLEAENANYKEEISKELHPLESRGMIELENCFKNLCKQSILWLMRWPAPAQAVSRRRELKSSSN